MKSSSILLAFYKAWLGETKHPRYTRRNGGLCPNLEEFIGAVHPSLFHKELYKQYKQEMCAQFHEAGLNTLHPFNYDLHEYRDEVQRRSCHTNKVRIQWVQDRIKDMEETE